jgi:hypothetical protein
MVFLTPDGHVHAFPDEADLSAGSVEWFPELEPLLGRPHPGWPKHRVRVDEQLGAGIAARAVPKAIVFPSIGPESRLEPIGAAEALVELTPNVLLTSGREAQAHLDVLGELARGTPCFRMTTGRDLGRAAELVGSLL